MIFRICWYCGFQTLSRKFMSLHDGCMLCFGVLLVLLDPMSVSSSLMGRLLVLTMTGHSRLHRNVQLIRAFFFFLTVSILRIDEIFECLSTLAHCRASVCRWPIAAFLFVELLSTSRAKFQASNDQALMLLEFL